MNETHSLHEVLSSRLAGVISWLSAALGIGTFMGFVNTLIGVLSACYLIVQIWNYFTHTRKQNALEMQLLERRVKATLECKDGVAQ